MYLSSLTPASNAKLYLASPLPMTLSGGNTLDYSCGVSTKRRYTQNLAFSIPQNMMIHACMKKKGHSSTVMLHSQSRQTLSPHIGFLSRRIRASICDCTEQPLFFSLMSRGLATNTSNHIMMLAVIYTITTNSSLSMHLLSSVCARTCQVHNQWLSTTNT